MPTSAGLQCQEIEKWYHCYDGTRRDLFSAESNAHPAKMSVALAYKIFEHCLKMGYLKRGDLVLDPMAGQGTTLIVGASLGFRTVGVELESHFIKMCEDNFELLMRKMPGAERPVLIQGDARRLSELLGRSDAVVSSPPYGDQELQRELHGEPHRRQVQPTGRGYSGSVSSPPYAESEITGKGHFKSRFEPHCSPAAANPREGYAGIVTSPPYSDQSVIAGAGMTARILREVKEHGMDAAVKLYRETVMDRQKAHGRWSDDNIRKHIEMALATKKDGYSAAVSSPPYPSEFRAEHPGTKGGQIALENQRGGSFRGYADAAVSSPPYSQTMSVAKKHGKRADNLNASKGIHPNLYGRGGAQIGNLKDPIGDIDAILSSPPWEDQSRGGQQGWSDPEKSSVVAAEAYKTGKRKGHPASAKAIAAQMKRDEQKVYGESKGQIGQERGDTYLSAMLTVYRELARVLKSGGISVLVTKNPVKAGQIRRLDLDTIRLMEAAGFILIEHKHAMLREDLGEQGALLGPAKVIRRERKSFFKRLHEARRPDLAVNFEDILFFRRAK